MDTAVFNILHNRSVILELMPATGPLGKHFQDGAAAKLKHESTR